MSGKEFTVAGAYRYDHRSPVRWVWSHVMRYPWLPIAFIVTVIGMATLQSWSAVLVGTAFDAVVGGVTLDQLRGRSENRICGIMMATMPF